MLVNPKLIIEHFKRYGSLKFDSPANIDDSLTIAYKLPPEKQLEYIRKRGGEMVTTTSWKDMNAEAHQKAFTVSGVMKADLLQEIYDHVELAKKDGWDLKKFQTELGTKLGDEWTGNNPSRLKIIYDTNMRTTEMGAKYKQLKNLAAQGLRPYWEYLASHASHPNPLHLEFYGKILRADDGFWTSYFPPSRHGCQCGVRALSDNEVKAKGLEISVGTELLNQLSQDESLRRDMLTELRSKLNVIDGWTPDTTKYVEGIRTQLESYLDNKNSIIKDYKVLTKEEGDKMDKDTFDLFQKNNPPEVINAVYDYMDISTFWEINNTLRTGKSINSQETQQNAINVKELLLNSKKVKIDKDITCFRGIMVDENYGKWFYEALEKKTISDKAFMSVSWDEKMSNNFNLKYVPNIDSVTLRIKMQKGTEVIVTPNREFILKPDTKLKITNVETTIKNVKTNNKTYIVDCELI